MDGVATRDASSGVPIVRVLGPFRLELPDGRTAGSWERPTARRLVQLLAVRREHRASRAELEEVFFAGLSPARAANAVSKALTFARRATVPYSVVVADRTILALHRDVVVDADAVRASLRSALEMRPGLARDDALVRALARTETVLEDELYADWAQLPRDEVERLRTEARVALACDRQAGFGRNGAADVLAAWQSVLRHDPADEQACAAVIASLLAIGDRAGALRAFDATRAALEELGLRPSRPLAAARDRIGSPVPGVVVPVVPDLEGVDDIRACIRAGVAMRRKLAPRSAAVLFRAAVDAAAGLGDTDVLRPLVVDAHLQLAEIERDREDTDAAAAHLDRARAEAKGDAEIARVWSVTGSLPYRRGDLEGAVTAYRAGLDELRGEDVAARVRLLVDLGFALGRLGRMTECLAILEDACAALDDVDDLRLAGLAYDHLATAQSTAGDHDAALQTMTRAFASMGPLDDDAALVPLHIHRALVLWRTGRDGEALADIAVAVRLTTDLGDEYALSAALKLRSQVHERRGDLDLALAARDEEASLLQHVGNHRHAAEAHAARAGLLERLGRRDEALVAAADALAAARATGDEAFVADVGASVVAVTRTTAG